MLGGALESESGEVVKGQPGGRAPERAGRRAVSDEEAGLLLRRGLMDRYRRDGRYQGIVKQDLAPLWRRLVASHGWAEERGPVFEDVLDELPLLQRQVPLSEREALAVRYVRAIVRAVGVSMGITAEGEVPRWALREVHADVTGREARHLLLISPRSQDDDLSLTLNLTPNHVSVRYYLDQSDPSAPPDQEFDLSTLGVGYGPEHWIELERIACEVIRQAVGVMREDIEDRHPLRNPTYIARWDADLDALYYVLFYKNRSLNPAESARLRRIADLLRIDAPGRRNGRPLAPGWSAVATPDDPEPAR